VASFEYLEKNEVFLPYLPRGVVSCKKTIKKPEVKEQTHEEKKKSKEVMDLEKAPSTRGEACSDKKNKSSFSNPFRKNQLKYYELRINPLVMERHWRSMSIKKVSKKKNNISNEVKHVERKDETCVSILLIDQGEVIWYLPHPTHEYKEYFLELHHPVEATPTFFLPTHENKEVVNFSHTDGFMKEPLDVVDENINTFICIGRHIWEMVCFIFYGDPICNIEGTFQIKNA
jgi:hypothetical protein